MEIDLFTYFITSLISIAPSLTVAYITLRVKGKMNKNKIKRAFITELKTNLQTLEKVEQLLKEVKVIYRSIPKLYTHMYEELIRNALLLELPQETANKIIDTYEDIKRYNALSYVSAIVILPPEKQTSSAKDAIIHEGDIKTLKMKIQQLIQELKTWQ